MLGHIRRCLGNQHRENLDGPPGGYVLVHVVLQRGRLFLAGLRGFEDHGFKQTPLRICECRFERDGKGDEEEEEDDD